MDSGFLETIHGPERLSTYLAITDRTTDQRTFENVTSTTLPRISHGGIQAIILRKKSGPHCIQKIIICTVVVAVHLEWIVRKILALGTRNVRLPMR